MSTFVITGGKKLSGSVETGSGKNGPIALLCAALLVKGEVTLKNMTRVSDVEKMLLLLESMGVRYAWRTKSTLWLDTSMKLNVADMDQEACKKMRVSLLLFGALASRAKTFKIYKTGGCKLGNRSIFPHVHALEKFGIQIKSRKNYYAVEAKKLKGADIVMYESGDTPTENAIMAAVLAGGQTRISFASANYMVQDVCRFLEAAGANIQGIGTTELHIRGVKKLKQKVTYTLSPDPVDAMAWISLAITTRSKLTIKNCPLAFLELELEKLQVLGQKFVFHHKRMSANGALRIADIEVIPSQLKAVPHKIYGRPFPGINIDNVSLFVPILTQTEGRTLVHEWCYENRALYYLELQKLGANVTLLDPHRVFVEGKTPLQGGEVVAPPAIRPAMAVLIAMIAAKGKSILRNTYPIERAYDSLFERLRKIGVQISRVEDA